VVDNICESLLQFNNWLSSLNLEQLIFLYQGMLPYSLHIICSLMSDFKHIPHVFCTFALRDSKKLIHVQWIDENVLCRTIKLCTLSLLLYPLIPWLVNLLVTNKMFRIVSSIHNCIPYTLINWFNENFHSNFPKLVVNTNKCRCLWIKESSAKGSLFLVISKIFCKIVFSHFLNKLEYISRTLL